MQKTLVKGVISGGSMSVLSREVIKNNNCGVVVMSSEESSSYPDDDSELELGLGLSLGCGVKAKTKGVCDQYAARILTAKDFCSSMVCDKASSSSSSSSASVTKANIVTNTNGSCGTKRTAEPSSPPGRSQVVGWPPVRTYRMNSLANQAKSPPVTEDFFSTFDKSESKNIVLDMNVNGGNRTKNMTNEKGFPKKSLFIKVNMDGTPIGRKVDLDAHTCYKSLARALDDMFGAKRSSEFVLTYEDKDGDWMLVGDVPWEMFLSSVRRLRIMRKAEANGLAPKIS